ncbi:MAG: hypothetical protein ILP07_02710 [Treponema sp.]|nr:hypothetical protein [Treponema sp.]
MAKKTEASNKKSTRRLFLGSFLPQLIIIFIACNLLYFIPMMVIKESVKSEIALVQEKVTSSVMNMVHPAILSVDNIVKIMPRIENEKSMQGLVGYLSESNTNGDVYYATTTKLSEGGIWADKNKWVPPAGWEPSARDWFKNAVAAPIHEGVFSEPYIDDQTHALCVTYSKAAVDSNGKVVGVGAADIILSSLNDILKETSSNLESNRYIIDSKGFYMTNDDQSKLGKANYFTDWNIDSATVAEVMKRTPLIDSNSKNYYGVTRIGTTPWYIVMDGDMKSLTGQLSRFVLLIEAGMLLMGIIFSIINLSSIKKMGDGQRILGEKLFAETQNLVVSTKETAATSQDQSAAVKEIVATMEDSNALSENISSKIKDVSKVAQKTSSDVIEGVASIEKNVQQLHAIYEANQQTITGMKDLNDKIESIWDIVTLINSVADQTKIIAFNAELEATSAGEAGKKFRIVANEIRRLSDGIIDSIHEIKEKITEIQHSSDTLILASENGTEKITSGYETAKELGTKFESIKSSSEITATSAEDITGIIQQQTIASEQILIALKQISAGIENFTGATDSISASAENLRIMSEDLNNQVKSGSKDSGKKAKA